MLITGCLVLFGIGGAVLANSVSNEKKETALIDSVRIIEIDETKPVEIKREKPKAQEAQKPVQTVKHVTYRIVPPEEVVEPIATADEIKNSAIGFTNIEGDKPDDNIVPLDKKLGDDNGIIVYKKKEDEIRAIVQVQAKYVGNWEKFLLRNLNAEIPIDNGAPPGRYTAIIQFVVDLDGTVSDVKALTSHGYGIEEEAVRVLRKAAKWEPGIQDGYAVKSYRRQPITFVVEGL
jgi:protein TonB